MSAPPPPVHTVMKGGAREHTMDILRKYAKPLEVYIGIALALCIVYVKQIPDSVRTQANSTIGRIFLFVITILIADTYSWLYGLITALLVSLLIAQAPRNSTMYESFQDKQMTKKVPKDRKWWVEEVFHENPETIQDELVSTTAIQDNSSSSSSTSRSR